MISLHQPTIFEPNVIAAVSSIEDGNMRLRLEGSVDTDATVVANREAFLHKAGIAIENTVLVYVTYDREEFTINRSVSNADRGKGMKVSGEMIVADALCTNEPGTALFLPLADCVGIIYHDSVNQVLMVSHLGRHSTIQEGARANIAYLITTYGCDPKNIKAWISPSVASQHYRMDYFDLKDRPEWQPFCKSTAEGVYVDIAGYNKQALLTAGVLPEHIEMSDIDTVSDTNYPSHVSGDKSRFAIVAMMR